MGGLKTPLWSSPKKFAFEAISLEVQWGYASIVSVLVLYKTMKYHFIIIIINIDKNKKIIKFACSGNFIELLEMAGKDNFCFTIQKGEGER